MKILLVEDVRSVAAVMMARLVSFGHEAMHAENGQIAIDLFRESAPDLVLMDIEMPVMNGFEATNRIRAIEATQQWAWTPIIFLTASDTVDNLITAIEAGGDDFMAKAAPEAILHAKMKAMARIATLRQHLSVANRKLEDLASRDGLTGLCNRRNLDLRIDALWDDAVQRKRPFALLMLDIDNFKKYNDHYGHQAGDACLRSVASTIASTVEQATMDNLCSGAFAARYGGEEFTVVIPDASNGAYETLSTAIVASIGHLAIAHSQNAQWGIVTISVGGARVDVAADGLAALFHTADQRLYRAKENGRNRAEIAT